MRFHKPRISSKYTVLCQSHPPAARTAPRFGFDRLLHQDSAVTNVSFGLDFRAKVLVSTETGQEFSTGVQLSASCRCF